MLAWASFHGGKFRLSQNCIFFFIIHGPLELFIISLTSFRLKLFLGIFISDGMLMLKPRGCACYEVTLEVTDGSDSSSDGAELSRGLLLVLLLRITHYMSAPIGKGGYMGTSMREGTHCWPICTRSWRIRSELLRANIWKREWQVVAVEWILL